MGPDLKEKNALTRFNYSFDTYSERGGGRGGVWCVGGGGGEGSKNNKKMAESLPLKVCPFSLFKGLSIKL